MLSRPSQPDTIVFYVVFHEIYMVEQSTFDSVLHSIGCLNLAWVGRSDKRVSSDEKNRLQCRLYLWQ